MYRVFELLHFCCNLADSVSSLLFCHTSVINAYFTLRIVSYLATKILSLFCFIVDFESVV